MSEGQPLHQSSPPAAPRYHLHLHPSGSPSSPATQAPALSKSSTAQSPARHSHRSFIRGLHSLAQKASTHSFSRSTQLLPVLETTDDIDHLPERVGSVKTSKPHITSTHQPTTAQSAVSVSDFDLNLKQHSSHPLLSNITQGSATHPTQDMSHSRSSSNPSIFDDHHLDHHNLNEDDSEEMGDHHYSDPTSHSGEDQPSYDLKAPRPSQPLSNIEALAERLFSVDHLKLIIRDHTLFTRFSSFLTKYRPHASQALQRYIETQKAVAAVDYANAVAEHLAPGAIAAMLEDGFEETSRVAVDELVNDALPGYVTHRLTQLVTDTLVKEITGQNTPIMRELVAGLAEVYCLTDPSLPDNPIVYASEEFFRTSQYGKDYVIGRNCRFLQGPKSSGASVARLVEALAEGQEICETILNYRRDGSPFMNLLLIAPLYDNKGAVRYFIGAQIDVNGLIENGRGLDSFERLLAQDRADSRYGGHMPKTPAAALGELSNMLNDEDMDIVRHSGRESAARRTSGASTPVADARVKASGRRYVGMDDPSDRNLWPAPHLGPSGRLPGVFQNYLLVRPYPSLRITFTSPALRIPGLLQSRFLDRIGGAPHIREGILSAMSAGVGVTAKVTWIPTTVDGGNSRGGSVSSGRGGGVYAPDRGAGMSEAEGKHRWIHCTPLIGSDEKVGVWMVVMVESENITGSIHSQQSHLQQHNMQQQSQQHNYSYPDRSTTAPGAGLQSPVYASTSAKLANQYFRREGRNDSMLNDPHSQFPRPPTSQTLVSPRQQEAGLVSKQSSTRGREKELPHSPTLGQAYPSHPQQQQHISQQTAAGARRGSAQQERERAERERGMPMSAAGLHSSHPPASAAGEVRSGPYTGYSSAQHPSGVRKGSAQMMSGMGTGSLTGAAATAYPSGSDVKASYPMGTASHVQAQGPQRTSSRLAAGGDKELSRERDVYERNRREMKDRQDRNGVVGEEAFADF